MPRTRPKRKAATILAMLLVAVAFVMVVRVLMASADYWSPDGGAYVLAATGGDVTLTSRGTVGRSLGSASMGGSDVLTLHVDCTAKADGQPGTWGQTFLGLRVSLSSRTVVFPFQRLAVGSARCRP